VVSRIPRHRRDVEYDETIVQGRLVSIDEPEWEPLERFLPLQLCGGFMWMHRLTLDNGRAVQAYKHSESRRYLLLDDNADAYENLDHGRFRRMRHSDAIEQVFDSWWLLHASTAADRDSLRQAFAAAQERGDGDVAAGAHILPSSPACAFRRLP
jgi:hypothetical protein